MSMDRRSNPSPTPPRVFMNCRLCWERIQLETSRVEELETGGFAYRCQKCENSYLLRLDDIVALGVAEQSPQAAES
jgi:predicted SprT family Zn-dependent metalloprotease